MAVIMKYIIIGDSCVGKSCIMSRYTDEDYKKDRLSTIGLEFKSKRHMFDGTEYNQQIWDTAGQEEYRSQTRNYYKGSTVCFQVYDVTRKYTYHNIPAWFKDLKAEAPDNIICILVANKIDDKENREVSFLDGKAMADDYNASYIEVSAEEKIRIDQLFEDPLMKINKQIKDNVINEINMGEYGIKIQDSLSIRTLGQDKPKQLKDCNICCK